MPASGPWLPRTVGYGASSPESPGWWPPARPRPTARRPWWPTCRLIALNLDGLDDRGRQELLRQIITGIVVRPDGLDVQGFLPLGPGSPPPAGGEPTTAAVRCATYATQSIHVRVPLQ